MVPGQNSSVEGGCKNRQYPGVRPCPGGLGKGAGPGTVHAGLDMAIHGGKYFRRDQCVLD